MTDPKRPSEAIPDNEWNGLVLGFYRTISDTCPVWETDFEGGTGLVVSVMDAAVAAAKHHVENGSYPTSPSVTE